MSFYSVWPFFFGMLVLCGVAATPLLAGADMPPGPGRGGRVATLDGLRGFLALAVVFCHVAIYRGWLIDGHWKLSPSRFYNLLGSAGVSMFFMITGYLFWSRLIADHGRSVWLRLYIGRIFRIGPLYLTAVLVMLAAVFLRTGPTAQVGALVLLRQVAAWLGLGVLAGGDVNGYRDTSLLLAGVTWTLQSEWRFYMVLPLLSLLARFRGAALPAVALALALCLLQPPPAAPRVADAMQAALFLIGMVCASLRDRGWVGRLPKWLASALVVGLLGAVFLTQSAYTPVMAVLLGMAFYLIACGCSVFGLLTSRAATRLGDISYGIYLLQGLVLAAVLRPAPLRAVALASPFGYWGMALLALVTLLLVATAAHRLIERPGIALGRRLADWLGHALPAARRVNPLGRSAAP